MPGANFFGSVCSQLLRDFPDKDGIFPVEVLLIKKFRAINGSENGTENSGTQTIPQGKASGHSAARPR
jgi:hypothetical protein